MLHAVSVLTASLFLPVLAGEGFRWRLDVADEICRPDVPEADSMGGITWVSNNVYWAVTDEKHKTVVWELDIPVDAATGKVNACRMRLLCRPEGTDDIEGIARDPLDGSMWLVDERAHAISRFDPVSGRRLPGRVELPAVMGRFRRDFGMESLTISSDGLSMWTCSEEALTPDGPLSTRRRGSDVRLARFVRGAAAEPWKPVGQWVYQTDPIAGKPWHNKKNEDMTRSGISELCLLDDGTLLTLEREFSVMLVPRFRCRIYETDFSQATDVLDLKALADGPAFSRVSKKLLHEATGFAMYEGMCLGPKLADGSRILMLVSDGDKKSLRNVLALRLSLR